MEGKEEEEGEHESAFLSLRPHRHPFRLSLSLPLLCVKSTSIHPAFLSQKGGLTGGIDFYPGVMCLSTFSPLSSLPLGEKREKGEERHSWNAIIEISSSNVWGKDC